MNFTNKYLGKYISLINRQANVFFTKEFSKFGFGSGQYIFMSHLYENDGISQERLSELVNIDKGTTAKAVKKLEELGFVTRSKDLTDKRVNRIYLTSKAFNIKSDFFSILTKCENILTDEPSPEEISASLNILNKISKNIANYN